MPFLQYAVNEVAAQLEAVGIRVTTDPRNAPRPPYALVDPPSFRVINPKLIETSVPVHLISSGPGNSDAATTLMALADLCVGGTYVMTGQPSSIIIGSSEYPCYDLTLVLTIQDS